MNAIIRANWGNFDTIKRIPKQTVDFEEYLFTNETCKFTFGSVSNRLAGKYFKIKTHKLPNVKEYDIYIWIDGNVQIISQNFVSHIIAPLLTDPNCDIVLSKHPFRKSIYEEADFVIDQIGKGSDYLKKRYNPDHMAAEISHLGKGIENLYYCGIFARRNTDKVNQIFDDWFDDNIRWYAFDQISFSKHAEKLNVSEIIFGDFYNNKYYQLKKHLKVE